MSRHDIFECMSVLALLLGCLAIQAGDAPALPKVTEEELQRIERVPSAVFPWKKVAPAAPKKTANPAAPDDAVMDLNSGEIIIKAVGNFSREERSGKEILTLTKDVEIEQLTTQSVLRGQTIRVVRDLKTGQTELLEAQGGVEVVTAERKGRGELLTYETQYGPQGQLIKDMYTIEGDFRKGVRAILWQGDDVIEAEKFVNDRRLDTFRVSGGPIAIMTIPGDPRQAPPKTQGTAGGMLPGLGVSPGGKIRLKADGEMFYEGSSGRVRITRNVILQQDPTATDPGMRITSDEALLTLLLPPPGQPAGTSVFSGSLKSMECTGRVEIKTATQTVLCDHAVLDMQKKNFVMEMKVAKDEVRVYLTDKKMALIAPKSLTVNMETSEFHSAGSLRMESFSGTPPSNRTPVLPKAK
ncbi:MAG TPA: hypothetical protein VEK08_04115 [Planctomycetota bacterium]|nr:hypothetical protein [Planctomycetota bacterium]